MNSSEHTRKGLFTVIYPFMAYSLHLAGLAKECFAVIFSFWISQGQKPVSVSLTTMQTITGGTRPAVIQAVHRLEEVELIVAERTPGKKTIYVVKIPEQAIAEFKELYPHNVPVKMSTYQEYSPLTTSSQSSLPQNKTNAKCKPFTSPLKVRPAGDVHTGGLKEA